MPKDFLMESPIELTRGLISPFLTDKDTVRLSTTSHAFYAETRNLQYWKNNFLEAGCNRELLEQVIKTQVIQNYKNLYCAFKLHFPLSARVNILEPWKLYCLSGEPQAIRYARKKEKVTSETKDEWGFSALQYVTLSGSLAGFNMMLSIPGMSPLAKSGNGTTVFHFAACSGSLLILERLLAMEGVDPLVKTITGLSACHFAASSPNPAMIDRILKIEGMDPLHTNETKETIFHHSLLGGHLANINYISNIPGMNLLAKNRFNNGAIHFAAWSGKPEVISWILKVKNIDPFAKTNSNETILHFAAWSGSPAVINQVLDIGIDPLVKNTSGETALHYAVKGGSLLALKCLLKINKMDFFDTTLTGKTLLHVAAEEGLSEMIKHLRILAHEIAPKIDFLHLKDNAGRDAFWYADRLENNERVKAVLALPIEVLQHNMRKMNNEGVQEKCNDESAARKNRVG